MAWNQKFRDLGIGDTFDFVSPTRHWNNYFARCVKLSARTYMAVDGDTQSSTMHVGSINVEIFNVEGIRS